MSAREGYQEIKQADDISKDRLARMIDRDVRDLSLIGFGKAVSWVVVTLWPIFMFQTLYCGVNVYLNVQYDWTVHNNVLHLDKGYRPFILTTLQLLAALMCGLILHDAIIRFKIAMAALLSFRNCLEGLRTQLLASTADPKLVTSAQVLLAFAVVLLEKDIVFFTEDFSRPILALVSQPFRQCVCFCPEVLWTCKRSHWQFIFHDFLIHSKLADPDGNVMGQFHRMVDHLEQLEDMVTVRSPGTRLRLTKFMVQFFCILIPLLNEDVITQLMTPLIATVFFAIIELARELANPWGETVHSIPLKAVMKYMCCPVVTDAGTPEAVDGAVKWLNRGLVEGVWETDVHPPIPRKKNNYPNKGEDISFQDMRTLQQIAGRKSWKAHIDVVCVDMDEATSRGRRMPVHLRTGSSGKPSYNISGCKAQS